MRWKFAVLVVCMFLALPGAWAQKVLTWKEGRLVFPWTNSVTNTAIENGLRSAEAWHLDNEEGDAFLGYVYSKNLAVDRDTVRLYIGIDATGNVRKVVSLQSKDIRGLQEFLEQFNGRSADSNFKIVQTAADLLTVPAPVKAIHGKEKLSYEIAREIEALVTRVRKVDEITPAP